MTIRRNIILFLPARLSALIACVWMGQGTAGAQSDVQDHLQISLPPIPRYRKARPAFEISADPGSKPIPPVRYTPLPPPIIPAPVAPPAAVLPSHEEIERKQARIREIQRRETEREVQHERLLRVGQALGFVLVVLIGLASVRDIVRQVRIARRAAMSPVETEDDDEEP